MAMIHSNRLAGWPVWGGGNDDQVCLHLLLILPKVKQVFLHRCFLLNNISSYSKAFSVL